MRAYLGKTKFNKEKLELFKKRYEDYELFNEGDDLLSYDGKWTEEMYALLKDLSDCIEEGEVIIEYQGEWGREDFGDYLLTPNKVWFREYSPKEWEEVI